MTGLGGAAAGLYRGCWDSAGVSDGPSCSLELQSTRPVRVWKSFLPSRTCFKRAACRAASICSLRRCFVRSRICICVVFFHPTMFFRGRLEVSHFSAEMRCARIPSILCSHPTHMLSHRETSRSMELSSNSLRDCRNNLKLSLRLAHLESG
jgi:hypothetical protein